MFLVEEYDYRYGDSVGRYYYKNIDNARKKFYEILADFFEEYPDHLEDFEEDGEWTLEDILKWHFSEQGYYENVVRVEEIKFLDE